jgi:hypothetical protein
MEVSGQFHVAAALFRKGNYYSRWIGEWIGPRTGRDWRREIFISRLPVAGHWLSWVSHRRSAVFFLSIPNHYLHRIKCRYIWEMLVIILCTSLHSLKNIILNTVIYELRFRLHFSMILKLGLCGRNMGMFGIERWLECSGLKRRWNKRMSKLHTEVHNF